MVVVLLACPEALSRRLRTALPGEVEVVRHKEHGQIREAGLVVVGPDAPQPVQQAQAAHRAAPDAEVLILTDAARLPALEADLRLAPAVSITTRAVPLEDHALVRRELRSRVERARKRQSHRAQVATSLARLERAAPPSRLPATVLLAQVFDHVPVGLLVVGPDGTVQHHNRRARELLGRDEDLDGLSLTELLGPEGTRRVEALAEVADGQRQTALIARDVPEGTQHLEIDVSRRHVPEGGESIVAVIEDVTERVERAERLATAANELRRAVRQLARSNAELEQFAYLAAHDRQEPLRTIRLYAQLLEKHEGEELDPTTREYLGTIRGSTERMHRLVQGLLAYSRVGGQEPPSDTLALDVPLSDALASLRQRIREEGAQVEVEGPLPRIVGSRTQLVQVFQNLIGNALKFRREEPPTIRIRAVTEDGWARVEVCDNGIGIPARADQRIFQIFRRLHPRERYEGLGIGLAVVQKIVEWHGGRVDYESEPGRGTTFRFTLPLA